jgi:NAD/NADP transhydrogenase beta subunit
MSTRRAVTVIDRGMSPGFAGIHNFLYYLDHILRPFGNVKSFVGSIVRELGASQD